MAKSDSRKNIGSLWSKGHKRGVDGFISKVLVSLSQCRKKENYPDIITVTITIHCGPFHSLVILYF